MAKIVTFLSDYGLTDEFVAVCAGVVLQIEPEARILDVSHLVVPGDVRSGALTLARAIQYLPVGVHLAVVDPGVGGERRAIALLTQDGRHFVGPDNGLLSPAVAISGGAAEAVTLDPSRWGMTEPSATFAGRDVFAPAAGALAGGVELAELGEPVAPQELVPLLLPLSQIDGSEAHGLVLWIDHYGNVQTNITESDVEGLDISRGDTLVIRWGERKERMPFVSTFSDVGDAKPLAFIDSVGQLAVAIRGVNAAEQLGITTNTAIQIERANPSLI